MRIRYKAHITVDGDTLRFKWRGLWWYARIVGLDADEIKGRHKKRAEQQKDKLDYLMCRWPRPKMRAKTGKVQGRKGIFIKHHNGRFLVYLKIWSWRHLGYVDYADYMKKKKMVKKNSRWNT